MKTLILMAMICSCTAMAQERTARPTDAPLVEPTATVFAPGPLAPGRSTKLKAGEPAPYPGQLLDEQEQVRRERVNERNAGELTDLKRGNVTISTPVFIAIVAGAIAAGAAVTFGIVKAAEKPGP